MYYLGILLILIAQTAYSYDFNDFIPTENYRSANHGDYTRQGFIERKYSISINKEGETWKVSIPEKSFQIELQDSDKRPFNNPQWFSPMRGYVWGGDAFDQVVLGKMENGDCFIHVDFLSGYDSLARKHYYLIDYECNSPKGLNSVNK